MIDQLADSKYSPLTYAHPKYAKSCHKSAKIIFWVKLFVYSMVTIIIFWWVFFNKGYLEISDRIASETVTGRYGYFETKFDRSDFKYPVSENELAAYNRFWAPNDYIRQGSAEHEFSIFTNFGITNVTRGTCSEDPQYDVAILQNK
jgi:hypothetical protein